jgi:hypothetical protein
VLNKLLCQFRATELPVDRNNLCSYLEDLSGSDRVETVQDAINALCRREQGGGCCDITISPGDDLEARLLNEIPPGSDAHICIRHGEYLLKRPVVLKGLGQVTVQGCGFGTVIRAPNSESAMIISDCDRAVVRNLCMRSNKLGDKQSSEFDQLNGALTLHNIDDVVVEHVSLKCPHGGRKMASCLTISNEGSTSSVRVNACRLEPGHQQVGILVVNARRAWIENNEIRVQPKAKSMTLKSFIRDKEYRLSIRKIILSEAVVVPRGTPADAKKNVEVKYEGRLLRFRTEPRLVKEWNALFSPGQLPVDLNNRDLLRHAKSTADSVLIDLADGRGLPVAGNAFNNWFSEVAKQLPAIASQAIVCGGTVANDLVITGNAIHGIRQGIHVGLSQRDDGKTYHAGRVLIRDNYVLNYLSSQVMGERHGIFVGNFNCLHIEDNHLEQKRFPANLDANIEGVRVYGLYGEMMQVRGNRLSGFRPAIYARAVNLQLPKTNLWQVENNLLLGGSSNDPDLQPSSKFIESNNPH